MVPNKSPASHLQKNPVYISVLENFEMESFVKSRISSFVSIVIVLVGIFLAGSTAIAVPQDQDKAGRPAVKKEPKKDSKKDEKKDAIKDKEKDEKKGGMTAETFSGLKFRSIGPGVASGHPWD